MYLYFPHWPTIYHYTKLRKFFFIDSQSSSVEITSYAILSFLTRGRLEDISTANSAARWLTTQRNALGGFYSTQDTAVALDALTRYQSKVSSSPTNLSVTISVKNGKPPRTYKLRDTDKLRTKQMTVSPFSDIVTFNISGQGCIILQVRKIKYKL